jgi:hypothetical protein
VRYIISGLVTSSAAMKARDLMLDLSRCLSQLRGSRSWRGQSLEESFEVSAEEASGESHMKRMTSSGDPDDHMQYSLPSGG